MEEVIFNNIQRDEIEINLKALFLNLKSNWYIILLGLIIGMLFGALYKYILPKEYKSSGMIYLRGGDSGISLQDLQIGSELTNDYEVILKSRYNLEQVIENLNLNYTYNELEEMITIENPENTRILKIEVISQDPSISMNIANEVINIGMNSIREIDSKEPYLVEDAIINNQNISFSLIKSIILGSAIGGVVSMFILLFKFIIKDNIKSIDDIENTLGLPVLAVVIEDKALSYSKKSNKFIKI